MLLFPKPKGKPKLRKPLKHRRTPIATKSVFKAFGSNTTKTYRRRFTDSQVIAFARQRRAERLQNRTRAEIAFAEILDGMGVLYESEAIFLNGDRFVLIDFLVRGKKIAFEIDGSAHRAQSMYDAGRDRWLLRKYGVKVLRLENELVMQKSFGAIGVVRQELENSSVVSQDILTKL